MIYCQTNFYSKILKSHVDVDVLLPSMPDNSIVSHDLQEVYPQNVRHPVLYLLHGALEDHSSWIRQTSIERYAEDAGVAVVMPSAQNGYYSNAQQGLDYFDFITGELPEFICYTFPVSRKREENFTAGASMGGYGAARIALGCPDQYAAFGCLSGAVDPELLAPRLLQDGYDIFRFDLIFGGAEKVTGSKDDLKVLAAGLKSSAVKPKACVYCGLEEKNNYDMIVSFRDTLIENGFDVNFEDGHGEHNWEYWERCIASYMKYIKDLLEKKNK